MSADPYHMSRPDLPEAEAAIRQLYGHEADAVWQKLLTSAGLTGRETDPAAVERLAATMLAADPVLALSGRGLTIRIKSYEYLLAAAQMIAEAPPAPGAAPAGSGAAHRGVLAGPGAASGAAPGGASATSPAY